MQLLVSLVLVLLTALPSAQAATTAAGSDIVFLVDQSGSMMGKGQARHVANDKLGKRIEAIKRLDSRLLSSAVAGYVNRISVIEFGGRKARSSQYRPQVTLARTEIPAVPPGQSPAATLSYIQSKLSPLRVVMRGDTDIGEAMSLAEQELDYYRNNPPVPGPGAKAGERQPIMVLITDGAPYADGVDPAALQAEIDAWTQRIKTDATFARFLVFGFNDQSRYWDNKWGTYWRNAATRDQKSPEGLAFLLPEGSDAVQEIGRVLSELIPPGAVTESEDTYTAPAYLKQLSFTIDFEKPHLPDGEIQVLGPPDGKGARLAVSERGELSAVIRLQHPAPGLYHLRSGGDPYRVHVLPVHERARLVAPLGSVKQYGSETVRYTLDGSGPGSLFVPQSNLPEIRFDLKVEDPNGTVRSYPMSPTQTAGEVACQAQVPFDLPGDYRLTFSGRTKARDGSEHEVYKSEDAIKVDDATPIQAFFAAPVTDEPLILWRGAVEVPVEVRFRDGHTGGDLNAADVLAAGSRLRIGWFPVGSDGQGLAAPVELSESGGALVATLPVDFGRTRWDLLRRTGGIRLELEPSTPDPWRDGLRYLGVDGSGDFWLGPEFQVEENPWVLGIWMPVLVAVVAAAVLLWRLFVVGWLIESSDRRYKRAPRLSFMVPRNPELGSKQWELKGQRIVTEPRLVTLADGDPWTIERFRIKRMRKPGNKVAVEVRYRRKDATKGAVKVRLEATNDSASSRARHRITGLTDNQAADFVLFVGKSEQK